jgi:predicted nucleotidyltransferase
MEDFKKLSSEFINTENLSSKIMGAVIGGSYARGEETPTSDIDLMLIIKNKYQSHYLQIHSSFKKLKNKHFSVIYQTEKN